MHRQFRTQLNLLSVVKVSVVVGIGASFPISLIVFLSAFWSGSVVEAILGVIVTLISGGILGLINGVFGYPFYYWYANAVRGQKVSGKFAEITPAESCSESK